MRIKNWQQFQHFKDRRPPWIKLYRDLLDDPDWHGLTGDDAKTLVMLWLVASESEGKDGALPELRKLSFRLRTTEKALRAQLQRLTTWLIHDDIKVISERYQGDTPETETETETEAESIAPTRQAGRSRKYPVEFDYDAEKIQGLTAGQKDRWQQAYPAVDVDQEVRKAQEWLAANPKKRKKDVRRFLNNWMSRCQERGGSTGPSTTGTGKGMQTVENRWEK